MGLSDPLKQLEYKPATCWSASLTTTVFHPHLEPPSMCTYLQVGLNGMLFQHEITLEELVTIIRAMPSELILSLERPMEQAQLAQSTTAPKKEGHSVISPGALAVRLPGKAK